MPYAETVDELVAILLEKSTKGRKVFETILNTSETDILSVLEMLLNKSNESESLSPVTPELPST